MQYLDFTLVVDKNNKPCVPILNGRAGYLLRNNKAKIINHDPLVIKRIDDYKSDFENRDIFELKIDSGYLNIGFSVSDNYHEYLAGQVELLKGMSDRLTNRNGYRRTRRSRIRYRKNKNVDYKTVHNPTYKNGNEEGWFAPSIQHKIDSHIRLIDKIASWFPVDKVIVEVAKFDIQMIKALADGKEISGKDYQNGEMKVYECQQKLAALDKEEEEIKLRQKQKRHERNERRRARRAEEATKKEEERRNEQIAIQKEAYLQAMMEFEEEKKKLESKKEEEEKQTESTKEIVKKVEKLISDAENTTEDTKENKEPEKANVVGENNKEESSENNVKEETTNKMEETESKVE